MINRILKGYQIVEKIKDGSVGTVWRAINSKNQIFALKQISEKNGARSEKVRQFKKEASLQMKLEHRHIIRVFEYVDIPPLPFFTMEYFNSENLKYSMWYLPQRVYKAEFYILRQVAEALAYIHNQGIIHKDIKPENILVAENSEIKLIDFSLAQTKWDRLLQFGKRIEGTPLYMAPEQIRGERCDPRTDIYSLGATIYELLTKRPPFLGTTEAALLQKHLKEPAKPMRTFVKTIASELDAMVLKMLSKKPEDRFPDMTSVSYELSKWEKKATVIRLKQVEPGTNTNRPKINR